ncbi:argininosuccinate lyase [Streptomyces sp. NPDC050560]|uniref:argininosuccinate lyase n=1 Tax=Streptomyces sp. NPDC050560 TaxID=3365630 RepID=UPI00378C6E1F
MTGASGTEGLSVRRRLGGAPSGEMAEFVFGPSVQRQLTYNAVHEVETHLAHVLMLVRQGIVPPDAGAALLGALVRLEDGGRAEVTVDGTEEDLYTYVERWVIGEVGGYAGGMLQTARSRNDLHTTAWRMALRERLLAVWDALAHLRETLLRLADTHAETVMPGYTHTHHAQPITFGYYLRSFVEVLLRDGERLVGAMSRVNLSPLGSAALSGTSFDIDRAFTADLLGFTAPLDVCYDGVASRDDGYEAAGLLSGLCASLSRLALDIQLWCTKEFGFLELSDEFGVASSIMPQKKSPVALERVKGLCGSVIGNGVGVLACAKNTSFADVNDGATEVNGPLMEAAVGTRMALGLLSGIVGTLSVRPERMLDEAASGFGTATDVAELVARTGGLSFRVAHNIVGVAVRRALAAGKEARELTPDDLDAAGAEVTGSPVGVPEADLAVALDPVHSVQTHTMLGGPARAPLADIARRQRARADAQHTEMAATADRVDDARARLWSLARQTAA